MKSDYDVIVVGGGPSGSCLAGNLARQGINVLVIEGKSFPREHIGESLLAMSMSLLRDLGVESKLHSIGLVRKPGSLLIWGRSKEEMELGMPSPGYAFQVLRSRFDNLLLEHAKEQGAHVMHEKWARRVLKDEQGRVCGLQVKEKNGQNLQLTCRFLVDASGLAQFLPRQLSLPIQLEGPKRIALGGYFRNALRPAAPLEGDTISEACRDGWLWFIPLSEEVTSVGFVSDEHVLNDRASVVLHQQIATSTSIRKLLEPAVVSREAQVLRYTNHMVKAPLWGKGYVLLGDSAVFVDPLFSTGVHGALYSASLAAAALSAVITSTVSEAEVTDWYDRKVRNHYFRVNETVKLLYGIHPGESEFWRSRDLSSITDEEAEQMVQRLGAQGMAFFISTKRTGALDLPSSLAKRVPEFISQTKRALLHQDQVLRLARDVELSLNWMCSQGQLVPAVSLAHNRNRTLQIELPVSSLQAKLLQSLDGQRTVATALQVAMENSGAPLSSQERDKVIALLSILVQAGLLSQGAIMSATEYGQSCLATVTGE